MESYECIICGGHVDEDVVVNVFLKPADGSWDREIGTPYLLNISPCCGNRQCVEAAWKQVKRSAIGLIELNRRIAVEPDDSE